jgi:hypothetical protein
MSARDKSAGNSARISERQRHERATATSLRAQARAMVRDRVPTLRAIASGDEADATPRDRVAAQRLLDRLRALYGEDFAQWTNDL